MAWTDVWERLKAEVVGRSLAGNEAGLIFEAEATDLDAVSGKGMHPRTFGGRGRWKGNVSEARAGLKRRSAQEGLSFDL